MNDTTHPQRSPEEMAELMARLARRSLHYHWKWFLAEGILLALIGLAAAVAPQLATLATDIVIGWVLIAAGLAGLAYRLTTRTAPGFWPGLLFALLTLVLGGLIAFAPAQGIITLTIALIAYLATHALYMILLTLSVHGTFRDLVGLALSALVDLLLIALVLSGWPGTATWIIGIFVGISLFFSGLGIMFAALGARQSPTGS